MKEALNVLKFTFQTAAWLKEGRLGQQPVAVLPEDGKWNTQQVDPHQVGCQSLLTPTFFFSSVLKNKNNIINNNKKNQTAFQTPECIPKEDNISFNWAIEKTELKAQITDIIIKQNKKNDVNI